MPQSKEVHKEYMKNYRKVHAKGSQEEGSQVKGSQYPAVVLALLDPDKRKKLEKIHRSLKDHGVLREVRYGIDGPTFDVVGEMLEVTGFPNIRA